MGRPRLVLHAIGPFLFALLLARVALAETPDELCAASEVNQRVALNETAFASCYNSTVWSISECPKELLFDETSQACVP